MSKPDIQYFNRDGIWSSRRRGARGHRAQGWRWRRRRAGHARRGHVAGGGSGAVTQAVGGAVMNGAGGAGGRGGATVADVGPRLSACGSIGTSDLGELKAVFYPADSLPDVMPVEVGKGGRPGGRDGYALIVTHLEETGEQR